jgi:hypothetical protein
MTPENNKLIIRRFTGEFINTASETLAAELIAPNAAFHVPECLSYEGQQATSRLSG